MGADTELRAEQAHLDRAYARLDHLQTLATRLATDELAVHVEQPAHKLEREARQATGSRRLADLRLGSLSLCFGRIDQTDGEAFHIGRLAVDDEDHEPLVVDWRAPVAEPFYRATPGEPLGLVRRRHLLTRERRVVGLEDEVLDLERVTGGDTEVGDIVLVGEAALFEALARSRTGRMGDIVATIQAEQDRAIRAPLNTLLVVQGGPGTGKTAVALHRAAYLLYRHRFPLEKLGILVIGPNPVFLRYIERVLPSLGENGCRLATIPTLREGVVPDGTDTPLAARVKGDGRMVDVLARAVADRERPLRKPAEFPFGSHILRLPASATRAIVDGAHAVEGSHNARRPVVEKLLVRHLYARYTRAVARSREAGLPVRDAMPRADAARAMRAAPAWTAIVDRIWPVLTAEDFLGDLFASPALLRHATDGLFEEYESAALARDRSAGWTPADIPLLDEADVLLGAPPSRPKPKATSIEEPEHMVERMIDDMLEDGVIFRGDPDMIDDVRDRLTMAVKAEANRDDETERPAVGQPRGYGHVVVDEAQDLSPMAWRMLSRRCPSGSMTVVGDLGQASGHFAPRSWDEVVAQVPSPRQEVAELTVNYRTPTEVMEVAAAVLAVEAPELAPARSVREAGVGPRLVHAPRRLAGAVVDALADELAAVGEGTVGVIVPAGMVEPIRQRVRRDKRLAGLDPSLPLESAASVLTLDEAKGLEFDGVVVVEPATLVAESPHGLRALYVALTRTTTRLAIVYGSPLPEPLAEATKGMTR